MTDELKTERVTALIEAYGADPGRWPEAERGALTEAVRRDPAVVKALARASALDAMLDAAPLEAALPSALRMRILERAPAGAPAARTAARRGWASLAWARPAGVAATLLLGVVGGYAGAAAAFPPAGPEQSLLGVALSDTGDPFAALLEDGA